VTTKQAREAPEAGEAKPARRARSRSVRTTKPAKTAKAAKTVIEVGSGVIQKNGRYLVSQRPEGSHLGQVWEFPGGKREANETIEACVARKVLEELGIEVTVGRLWRVVERQYPERVVRLHFFLCQLASGTPRAIGCQRFRWIQPGEFGSFEFPPADLDIIQELARKAQRAAAVAAHAASA
jgi:8-oxo-dGTP diphosphatase